MVLKQKIKKILIINQHSNNRGDEAALKGLVYSLLEEDPNLKFDVLYASKCYPVIENSEKIKTHPDLYLGKYRLLVLLINFIFVRLGFNLFFNRKFMRYIKLYQEADLVIHAPGGPSIGDIFKSEETKYLLRLFFASLCKKKMVFCSPSFGPFRNRFRNLLRRYVLNKSKLIMTRDIESFNYLKKLKISTEVILTADNALQNPIKIKDYKEIDSFLKEHKIRKNSMLVGLTPISLGWHPLYKKRSDLEQLDQKIVENLAGICNYLQKKHDVYLLVFPQRFGDEFSKEKFEQSVIEEIKKGILQPEKFIVVDGDYDSIKQQKLISLLDFYISCRYHPCIFSAKMGKVPIAIYYEHKTLGFMKSLDLAELAIDVKEMDYGLLKEKLDYLLENRKKLENKVKLKIRKNRDLSKLNTKYVLKFLRE